MQRNFMQMYGYALPNTPNLAHRAAQTPQNLLVFSNVIAAQAQTAESLSQALSFANQDNPDVLWYQTPTLMDTFKLGGYNTIAISNQEAISLFGNGPAIILKRANTSYFLNDTDKFDHGSFDGNILPILREMHAHTHDPSLYVVHLLGNHATYYKRYPSEFARFSAASLESSEECRQVKSEYANALLYSDSVIESIIEAFASEDSLIVYISDHGEEVCDLSAFYGHANTRLSRYMLEIPFIVYVSDTFRQKHPQIYAKITNTKPDMPFMLDDLLHTLVDIAGIRIEGFEPQRSLFATDSTFLHQRARKVGPKYRDYDKELK